jgi:hypothetical protein
MQFFERVKVSGEAAKASFNSEAFTNGLPGLTLRLKCGE